MRKGKAKVAWEVVCLPKQEGGLGIRRLEAFNAALIAPHIWSILASKESLWVKWIHANKLRGRNFWDIPFRGNMSWGWRKILQVRPLIRQFIWHRLGDGNVASVWFDRWSALSPLASLVSNRDINRAGFHSSSKVVDVLDNGSWNWPIEWQDKYPMVCSLTVPTLDPNSRDLLVWRNQNDVEMQFSVATVWDTIRPRGEEVDWYKVVWFSHCIPRHAFHLWLVIKRKLKTQDALRQWDVSGDTNLNLFLCPLCEMQPDSHEHLFFDCTFSSQIWAHMKVLVGLPNVSPSLEAIVNYLVPISKKRSARSVIAKLVVAACSYFIWQERNHRLFKKRKRSKEQVLELIMSTVRLKLLSCRFKKTPQVEFFAQIWNIPTSLIRDY